MGKIYYIEDPITNEIRYVGQTIKTLHQRLKGHIYEARRSKKYNINKTYKNNWLNDLISKGYENKIKLTLIEECQFSEMDKREIFWINWYKESCGLTNTSSGGIKQIMTDEIKKKISIANSGEKNGMYGKRFKKNKKDVEYCRLRMINSEKFQKSRKSLEFRKKISLSQKVDDWLLLDEEYNIIKIFNTSIEVSTYLNCTKGNIQNARRDKRKLCKKFFVMYKKDYELIKK